MMARGRAFWIFQMTAALNPTSLAHTPSPFRELHISKSSIGVAFSSPFLTKGSGFCHVSCTATNPQIWDQPASVIPSIGFGHMVFHFTQHLFPWSSDPFSHVLSHFMVCTLFNAGSVELS